MTQYIRVAKSLSVLLKILQVCGLAASAIIMLLSFVHAVSPGGKQWVEAITESLIKKTPRSLRMLVAAVILAGIVAEAVHVVFPIESRTAKNLASDAGHTLAENILLGIKAELSPSDIGNLYGQEVNQIIPKLRPSGKLSAAFRNIGAGDSIMAWSNLAVEIKQSSLLMKED